MDALKVRLALVDDHPIVLSGLQAALKTVGEVCVVAQGSSIADARVILERDDIDVVLLDVRLPDGNGIELLARPGRPERPAIIVLSSFRNRQYVAAAIRFGAQGFLLKSTPLPELVDAIRRVAAGGSIFSAEQLRDAQSGYVALTVRERQILALMLQGKSNDEIAVRLKVSRKTIEVHLSRLYTRFGAIGRVDLALRVDHEGWLEIETNRTDATRQASRRERGHITTN
jgi:two-component system, NarL family, nitrate/nitrite response regulator NarL